MSTAPFFSISARDSEGISRRKSVKITDMEPDNKAATDPITKAATVGYGFGDDHLNEIIDAAMTNPSLIMLIVNPNPTDELRVKLRRYQDIGERVFLLCPAVSGRTTHATFEDFAINLMPQVQWLEDFVKLRRYEKMISDGPAGEAIADARGKNETAL
jgi:nitroreductase